MNDFSSDKILDTYARLNSLTWRDADCCSSCGMFYSEVGDSCKVPLCPLLEEEKIKEDDDE